MTATTSHAATTTTADGPTTSAPADPPVARRRRSPATNAKIVTVGASVTAMFGMIAGYGIADGLTAEHAEPVDPLPGSGSAVTAPTVTEIPPASSSTAPVVALPQVIVVVVDGATGRTLSTTTGTGDLGADLAAAGITPTGGQGAPAAPPSVDPSVPATAIPPPAAVDLAVPAPPPSVPRAAPAPQPQATSDGS